MSDSDLDDLIDELFPEKRTGNAAKTVSSHASAPSPHSQAPRDGRRRSEWDDDSDDAEEVVKTAACTAGAAAKASTAALQPRTSVGHSFDSDDDSNSSSSTCGGRNGNGAAAASSSATAVRKLSSGGGGGRDGVPALRRGMSSPVLHPVPFPSLADSDGAFACAPRCYVTNYPAALKGDSTHPTLLQLRDLAANERSLASCTRAQALMLKGVFYAVTPKLGNGCLDHHGDYTCDGGCPHLLCRRCNYMVVRLQGAEWDDGEGGVNLYLTLRNYYPDWCRLASETPVGVDDGQAGSRYVLKANPSAAAYCCQCCWLTVRTPKAVIETKLTDAFTVKQEAEGGRHAFATELPLVTGEKRRPPLWVCHGHPQ